jgi:hypothetical protein
MTTTLYQKDFTNGPYHIMTPGKYKLGENIVVDFQVPSKSVSKYNPLASKCPHLSNTASVEQVATESQKCPAKSPNFKLGFTASVIVACDGDIDFDMNGFSMIMSNKFYITQRFYSHFQLNISPFRTGRGPVPKMAEPFQDYEHFPSNIRIHSSRPNGTIGLTSHMGVMANNVDNIVLENLLFKDNEVAPAILNNCSNVKVNNCVWDNKDLVLPVNSSMSNLVQLTNRLQTLVNTIITGTRPETVAEITQYLKGNITDTRLRQLLETELMAKKYLQSIYDDLEKNNYQQLSNTYNAELGNPSKQPDGSALYGLSLVNKKAEVPGIGPITKSSKDITLEPNVFINKFTVQNIHLACLEIPAITYADNEETSGEVSGYDSVGTLKLFSGEVVFFHNLRLRDTPFFDLVMKTVQTMINIRKLETSGNQTVKITQTPALLGTYNFFDQDMLNALKIARTNIRTRMGLMNTFAKTVDEAALDIREQYDVLLESSLFRTRYNLLWNQDLMQHKIKGLFLVRMEGVNNFMINKVIGNNVVSSGIDVNSKRDNAVSFFHNSTDYNYMGCDIYGVTLAHCKFGLVDDVKLTNVEYTKGHQPECIMVQTDSGITYSSDKSIIEVGNEHDIDIKTHTLNILKNKSKFSDSKSKSALFKFLVNA